MASHPDPELEELRLEVDRIDRATVELLAERLRVVREIARRKRADGAGGPAIRPGREAQILRRLVAQAGDRFPAATLVRMWRELLAATTRAQAPLAVTACVPPGQPELWDIARDHFGSTAPIRRTTDWSRALRLVASGDADLAVLPLPADDDPWWPSLVDAPPAKPLRVIARLPFGPAGTALAGSGAMVVGAMAPEPSGADVSMLAVAVPPEVGRRRLLDRLAAAELQASPVASRHDREPGPSLHLLELDGFVPDTDPRLTTALRGAGEGVLRGAWLGGYARPLAAGG